MNEQTINNTEGVDFNAYKYMEMVSEAQREVEQERQRLLVMTKRVELLDQCLKAVQEQYDINVELQEKNCKQQKEIERFTKQLADEKKQREELEMKLAELNKLSAGMAKKSSEEAMLKALRTYANTSKRKTVDKRTFAKTAILELANVNGLVLPDDLAATIESLDDEQPDTKVVNVAGNYNDIHDNGTVNQK